MNSSTLAMRKYTRDLRQKVLTHLGRKCVRCSFSDERALQVDHINGGGNKQRKTLRWREMYREVLNSEPGKKYQLLCANCNWIKREENKEHLRQTKTLVYRERQNALQKELNERSVSQKKFWKRIFEELEKKPLGEEMILQPSPGGLERLRGAFQKAARHRGFYCKTRRVKENLLVSLTKVNPWVSPLIQEAEISS